MKNLLLFFLLFFILNINKANTTNEKDSIFSSFENKAVKIEQNISSIYPNWNKGIGVFLKIILFPITSFLPIWGYYDEGSVTNRQIPLLNFDRSNGKTPNDVRQKIIDKLNIVELELNIPKRIYNKIYENALSTEPADTPKAGITNISIRAKNAAFIYWLGVNKAGEPHSNDS